MRKLLMGIGLMILCTSIIRAQAVRKPVATNYVGLGAYSMQQVDVFSFTSNQASLAQVKDVSVGAYGERRFMINEANMYTGVFAIPTSSGNFGVQADHFGFPNYNETQLGVAYGRSLGDKVDLGVKFNYYSINIPTYGNNNAVNFEIGTIIHLTDKINAGLHAFNPTGSKFGKNSDERISSIYKAGIGYDASDKFFVSTEVVKEEDKSVNVNFGMQYKFHENFMARAGIETETSKSFWGVGMNLKSFRLDVAASYHPQLGFSPGVLLAYSFKKTEQ